MHISKLTVATGDDARTYASFYPHSTLYTESNASESKAAASTHESFEPAGCPAPLRRSSSVSSISSTYSSASDDSWSSTESSSPEEGTFPIIGILKKPRRRSTTVQQRRSDLYSNNQGNNHHDNHNGDSRRGNLNKEEDDDDDEEEEEAVEETDDSWEDADDCDIGFERHVTFTDPVATDIVDGSPVPQSALSRTEWTALRLRMKMEQMRLEWTMMRRQPDTSSDSDGDDEGNFAPGKKEMVKMGRQQKKTVPVRKSRKNIYEARYAPSTTIRTKTWQRGSSRCC
ncbi:hypothetical protein F5Y03DRAFT_377932 [Xylaria venustula]|nr:hypothetical protein F5Y03DRAFT_377932 [Xylaria venustula]